MESKKPRVGVDVDGVLADFLTPAFKLAYDTFGIKVDLSQHVEWDLETLIPKDKMGPFWKVIGQSNFHQLLKPYPDAVKGLKNLKKVAEVYIVTSHLHSGTTWTHDRDNWLKEHFGLDRAKNIHTRSKHVFYGRALVDDKPENINDWQAEHPTGHGVLWLQPYNRRAIVDGRLRTDNWDELIEYVQRIEP